MSGVIDHTGQQFERCNICHKFFRFPENLGYIKADNKYKYGRMGCVTCIDKGIRNETIDFWQVVPAPEWEVTEE